MRPKLSVQTRGVQREMQRFEGAVYDKVWAILHLVGADLVAWLRSYTNEWRPPAPGGAGMRRAHPGHWADITHKLEQGYGFRVEGGAGKSARLIIFNTTEYAVYLEAKEGFFVVSGAIAPNGPFAETLRKVVARHAPGWRVNMRGEV